ncbi:MAG: Nif3-like dinuclear metal center hexameric protein [Clostridia bacterium]|nr:Nif3-like dinuclear metal center hexameric protein [Clostridia bacterium]
MHQVTVGDVLEWVNGIAPFDLAEVYDNVGLLAGSPREKVQKILFCVDATQEAADDAANHGAQLILTHHPLMFGGIRRVDYTAPDGKALRAILGRKLNVIAAHTNLDKASGGIADSLADALCLQGIQNADHPGTCVRIGELPSPMSAAALAGFVAKRLHAEVRRYGDTDLPVNRVAVGPGAGGDGVEAAVHAGAQCYVVGEIKHHELLLGCGQGLVVLEAGHYATEAAGVRVWYERFQRMAVREKWDVEPLLFSKIPFFGALRADRADLH